MIRTIINYKATITSCLITLCFFINSCHSNTTKDKHIIELNAFKTEFGWGYKISIDKINYINQPVIPVINGNIPFKSEEDALKTGRLVVKKIKAGEIPPSLTVDEIRSLNLEGL